jgi:hypothetical protein
MLTDSQREYKLCAEDKTLRSLLKVNTRFRETRCVHFQDQRVAMQESSTKQSAKVPVNIVARLVVESGTTV